MNERAESAEPQENGNEPPQVPLWLCATTADLQELDIAGSATAGCHKLSDLYRAAIQLSEGATEPADTPATRVF
ncbi:MAG: hypothetical protein M3145_08400, partial [Pseudomonadota bacterium]|nr:hypothetical protein [Pseudomonadota bacterium]